MLLSTEAKSIWPNAQLFQLQLWVNILVLLLILWIYYITTASDIICWMTEGHSTCKKFYFTA